MKLTSEDLTITCVNITPLLSHAYEMIREDEDDYEIFNPSVVYDLKHGVHIVAARVFISHKGLNNRKSWVGRNLTIFCRIDSNFKELRAGFNIVSSLLGCQYRSSAISQDGSCVGSEDVRIQFHGDTLWAIGNEEVRGERKVVLAEIDRSTFDVIRSGIACPEVQTAFEKNWSLFERGGKWYVLYKLSPLETISIHGKTPLDGRSKKKTNSPTILDSIVDTFQRVTEYNVEIRNRTSPVSIGNGRYLCMGGVVVDWRATDSKINNLLVPGISSGESEYDRFDQEYWSKKYAKLYLCFFFVFNMDGGEITIEAISSFFQLPSKESTDELVVFPTTLSLRDKKSVVVSYGVGDNRSYVCILPFGLVELMLQPSEDAVLFQTLNLFPDELIHVCRVARRVLGFKDNPGSFLLRDALKERE